MQATTTKTSPSEPYSSQHLSHPIRCPLCDSALILGQQVWHCSADNPQQRVHSFDVAKQGYVNLLPVQHKKSKNPGDTEQAIQARQRFLAGGFYQPLRQALIDCAKSALQHNATWLDIGCGEGYYTQGFLTRKPANLVALDISKPAVMATAKALKAAKSDFPETRTFAIVASASQVPMRAGSVGLLTSIFSPILPAEFARLVGQNGQLIIAKPAKNHLYQMRQGLFDDVIDHDSDKFIAELSPFFTLNNEQTLTYDIKVTASQLSDLLTMTPYAYRAKPANYQALLTHCEQAGQLTLTVDFVIYQFDKTA